MTMEKVRGVFTGLCSKLSVEEAEAIVAISQLVVDIDGREGPDEIKLFFDIGNFLFALAGKPGATVPTFASDEEDEERMFELATALKGAGTRELAYAVARVLAASDLQVAPEEDTFIDRLRGVLSLARPRAAEIDALLRAT
jgi:hypothetical protein